MCHYTGYLAAYTTYCDPLYLPYILIHICFFSLQAGGNSGAVRLTESHVTLHEILSKSTTCAVRSPSETYLQMRREKRH